MKTYKIKLVVEVYDNDINEQAIREKIKSLFVNDNAFACKLEVTEIE